MMSATWPGVIMNLRGFPRASTLAWTFVVKPPLLRPRPSSACLPWPAAHGCALTIVASTDRYSWSGSCIQKAKSFSHTPFLLQASNLLYTLFHAPYRSGNSPPLRSSSHNPVHCLNEVPEPFFADDVNFGVFFQEGKHFFPRITCDILSLHDSSCSSVPFFWIGVIMQKNQRFEKSTGPKQNAAANVCCVTDSNSTVVVFDTAIIVACVDVGINCAFIAYEDSPF